MQVGGSQEDLLQGVSPSSTIRDLEAACGPLSAASGPLDASALPPSQDAAILPLLWARFTGTIAFMSESPHSQGLLIPHTSAKPLFLPLTTPSYPRFMCETNAGRGFYNIPRLLPHVSSAVMSPCTVALFLVSKVVDVIVCA